MKEITVNSPRLPIRKGSSVPGYPDLTVGRYVGGSPYTLDRIYDLVDKRGKSSGMVIKVCWQPLGVPLGMSMRALEHEWVMHNNIQVFCSKHPELSIQLLHAQAAIFTSQTPSSIFGCCPGVPFSQQQGKHHQQQLQQQQLQQQHGVNGGSSSSSDGVSVREVTAGEAAQSISSTTSAPKRTTAALIVEKADGLTVKQRIKKKSFNNIRYIAELLLQLPKLLRVLENELGFVHDDLRLDNIMEMWQDRITAAAACGGDGVSSSSDRDVLAAPAGHLDTPDSQARDQQQQGVWAATPTTKGHPQASKGITKSIGNRDHTHLQQSSSSSSSSRNNSDTPIFKLFDFGLSIINPDHYSRGPESRAPPHQRKAALKRLHQQGYAFHKALGIVNLVHVVQFGRAADIYRLCKSLSGHLSKRTWPAADRPLVEACFQLLATISGKTITAYFAGPPDFDTANGSEGAAAAGVDTGSDHHHHHQQQQQHGFHRSADGDVPSVLAASDATLKLRIAVKPGSSSGGKGLGRWLQQQKQRRQMHQEAIGITAGQLMQLQQFKQLASVMKGGTETT